MRMKLVTAKLREKLLRNGARPGADHIPVLNYLNTLNIWSAEISA